MRVVGLGRLEYRHPQRDYATTPTPYIHRGFTRHITHSLSIIMQLTSILSAAVLPLLALAQTTVSGTTTMTATSTLTKTVTLASNTVTMTSGNSTIPYTTGAYTGKASHAASNSASATGTSSASSTASSSSETPGVNGLGNGAASLHSANIAVAGLAGMLVAALM